MPTTSSNSTFLKACLSSFPKQLPSLIRQCNFSYCRQRICKSYAPVALQYVQVHASVREMEGNLENMALSQQNANEGIFLLCK